MAATVMGGFLDRVRATVGSGADPRTDAQLLTAFSGHRDPSAFALLVHRYGALVWAVCRRTTGDDFTAEDAFQATFLVLARKAGEVRPRHSVGGWLHRTATHIALKARTRRVFCRTVGPEHPAPEPAEPIDPAALAVLDEEIARLPDLLREAVVLCELQSVPRREAAVRLGVAEGTVSSRLAAARKRLALRLRGRGVCLAGAAAGVFTLGGPVGAGVPPVLIAVASALGADESPAVPLSVSALASREVRTMFLTPLTLAASGTVALLAVAIGLWPSGEAVATHAAPRPAAARAPVPPPAPPREGVIVVNAFPPYPAALVLTPDGKEIREVAVGAAADPLNPGERSVCPLGLGRLSPDGKRLVAVIRVPIPQNNVGPWTRDHLWVFDLGAKDGPTEALMTDVRRPSAVWSADGKTLYGSHVDPEKVAAPREDEKPIPLVSWVYDLATRKKAPLALPSGHQIVDLSPDGKTLLTVVFMLSDPHAIRSYLVPLDTLKPRALTKTVFNGMRFSPDGKWVLGNRAGKAADTPPPVPLATVSVADGTERPIALPDKASWVYHACWSPDGKRIAFHWIEELAPPPGPVPVGGNPPEQRASRVTVADADGRNPKIIVKRAEREVTGLDWK